MTIKLSKKQRIKILGSKDVFRVMKEILKEVEKVHQDKKHFWVMSLAGNGLIINIELVSMGNMTVATVEPMKVYRIAVLKNAEKVVFIHNYTHGELEPTAADKEVTDRLIQAGRILNIEVIEHLIISKTSFMSFADTGLLEELRQSTKWLPQYDLIKRLKEEERKLRLKAVWDEKEKAAKIKLKALKNQQIEIAKRLKKNRLSLDLIKTATGLTTKEIRKIR